MPKHSVSFCVRKDFNSTGLTTSYKVVNTAGFEYPVSILKIINGSGKDISISFDGTNNHDYIQASDTLKIDFQSNSLPVSGVCNIAKGTKVYVKSTGASTGYIYVIGYGQGT